MHGVPRHARMVWRRPLFQTIRQPFSTVTTSTPSTTNPTPSAPSRIIPEPIKAEQLDVQKLKDPIINNQKENKKIISPRKGNDDVRMIVLDEKIEDPTILAKMIEAELNKKSQCMVKTKNLNTIKLCLEALCTLPKNSVTFFINRPGEADKKDTTTRDFYIFSIQSDLTERSKSLDGSHKSHRVTTKPNSINLLGQALATEVSLKQVATAQGVRSFKHTYTLINAIHSAATRYKKMTNGGQLNFSIWSEDKPGNHKLPNGEPDPNDLIKIFTVCLMEAPKFKTASIASTRAVRPKPENVLIHNIADISRLKLVVLRKSAFKGFDPEGWYDPVPGMHDTWSFWDVKGNKQYFLHFAARVIRELSYKWEPTMFHQQIRPDRNRSVGTWTLSVDFHPHDTETAISKSDEDKENEKEGVALDAQKVDGTETESEEVKEKTVENTDKDLPVKKEVVKKMLAKSNNEATLFGGQITPALRLDGERTVQMIIRSSRSKDSVWSTNMGCILSFIGDGRCARAVEAVCEAQSHISGKFQSRGLFEEVDHVHDLPDFDITPPPKSKSKSRTPARLAEIIDNGGRACLWMEPLGLPDATNDKAMCIQVYTSVYTTPAPNDISDMVSIDCDDFSYYKVRKSLLRHLKKDKKLFISLSEHPIDCIVINAKTSLDLFTALDAMSVVAKQLECRVLTRPMVAPEGWYLICKVFTK